MNLLEQLDIKNRATARSRYITPICMRVCKYASIQLKIDKNKYDWMTFYYPSDTLAAMVEAEQLLSANKEQSFLYAGSSLDELTSHLDTLYNKVIHKQTASSLSSSNVRGQRSDFHSIDSMYVEAMELIHAGINPYDVFTNR